MKKAFSLTFGLLYLGTIINAQITSSAPYCAASYDDAGGFAVDHHITQVKIGALNNSSGTNQFSGGHYVYYNNIAAPSLVKNTTYSLTVGHDGGSTIHFLAVYIDFNKDNDFLDAGERVLQKTINDVSAIPNPAIINVTIPSTATTGVTRMRVLVFEDDEYTWMNNNINSTSCTTDATGFLDWGETEDYNLNITSVTGIEETLSNTPVFTCPNPVENQLSIIVKEDIVIETICIKNINGDVMPLIFNQTKNIINSNLSSISEGIYFLEISTSLGFSYKKLIKN